MTDAIRLDRPLRIRCAHNQDDARDHVIDPPRIAGGFEMHVRRPAAGHDRRKLGDQLIAEIERAAQRNHRVLRARKIRDHPRSRLVSKNPRHASIVHSGSEIREGDDVQLADEQGGLGRG